MTLCLEDRPWGINYLGHGDKLPKDKPGYMIELLNQASDLSEQTITYVRYPWKRCMLMVSAGDVDGLIGAGFRPERAQFAQYPYKPDGKLDHSLSFSSVYLHFYVPEKSRIEYEGINLSDEGISYKGKITVVNGYSPVRKTIEQEFGLQTQVTPDRKSGFLMLIKDRAKIMASDAAMADKVIRENHFPVKKLPKPFKQVSVFLIFNKAFYRKNKQQADKLWLGIRNAKTQSGQAILSKYQASNTN